MSLVHLYIHTGVQWCTYDVGTTMPLLVQFGILKMHVGHLWDDPTEMEIMVARDVFRSSHLKKTKISRGRIGFQIMSVKKHGELRVIKETRGDLYDRIITGLNVDLTFWSYSTHCSLEVDTFRPYRCQR